MTKKLLIVDDEPNIAISLQFLMRREGYDVSLATNGEEGLAKIRQLKPDLVLLDVMMPKMDGFQVCRAVREEEQLAGVRIVMLTAKGREAEAEKGLSLGADAYIPKPFSTSELVSKVNSLLEP